MREGLNGRSKLKYLVSIYPTIIGEECFLGKECQLIKITEANRTLKYSGNRRNETF